MPSFAEYISSIFGARAMRTWLILTVFYLALVIPHEFLLPGSLIAALVGMFVPVGIWIAVESVGIAVFITFGVMYFLDSIFARGKSERNIFKYFQYFVVLLVLFLLVMIFDFIFFQDFVSLQALLFHLGIAGPPPYWS